MPIILIPIKASLLLASALAGAWLLRAAPAATRHALWSVTFAALLTLPWLGAAVPAVRVPVPPAWTPAGADTPRADRIPDATPVAAPIAASSGVASRHRENTAPSETAVPAGGLPAMPSIGVVARVAWLTGAAAATGALLLSLLRVRRLVRAAAAIADPSWREAADALGARLGLRRPARVLFSDAVRTPMAGGVWRPLIFLPTDALSWTPERRDIVLAHELSHIAGRDPLRHLAARLAVACYWFHPLAWIAARQSSLAREQACDEAVLALGIRPSEYARVLLDLADTMAPSRRAAAALPMVERSLLETRLMAILDHSSRPSGLRPIVPAACAASLALFLAAAQPAARSIDLHSPGPAAPMLVTPPDGAVPSVAVPPAPQTRRDAACWDRYDGGSFTGYTNTDSRGAILEQVGSSGATRIIQQQFGDMRICMLAQGETADRGGSPTAWAGRAPRIVIETVRSGSTAHIEIIRLGGAPQTTWRVNGADRPFDAAAQSWRDAALAVLDRTWEISTLRGQESSLRGEMSSLRGEESSLRGEISSLRGEVSSMRGEQSSIRGEESSLRGEISTIQGHLSTLRGDISTERGYISALEASRYNLSDAERAGLSQELENHRAEIKRLEQEISAYDSASKIAEVEKQIRALDADRKVAAIEDQIRAFGEAGKIAAIEKGIEALNVNGKVADLERQIGTLDVDGRTRRLEADLDEAIRRLERALAAIR